MNERDLSERDFLKQTNNHSNQQGQQIPGNQALPVEIVHAFAQFQPWHIEQFNHVYQFWSLQQQIVNRKLRLTTLVQQIAENTAQMLLVEPSPLALSILAQFQANGVHDVDLLDRMLEQGDTWLDRTQQLLERCEALDVIQGDYAQWCENALEGAYDWITTMDSAESGSATVDDSLSADSGPPAEPAAAEHFPTTTEEQLLQKLMSEEDETEKLPILRRQRITVPLSSDAISPDQPLEATQTSPEALSTSQTAESTEAALTASPMNEPSYVEDLVGPVEGEEPVDMELDIPRPATTGPLGPAITGPLAPLEASDHDTTLEPSASSDVTFAPADAGDDSNLSANMDALPEASSATIGTPTRSEMIPDEAMPADESHEISPELSEPISEPYIAASLPEESLSQATSEEAPTTNNTSADAISAMLIESTEQPTSEVLTPSHETIVEPAISTSPETPSEESQLSDPLPFAIDNVPEITGQEPSAAIEEPADASIDEVAIATTSIDDPHAIITDEVADESARIDEQPDGAVHEAANNTVAVDEPQVIIIDEPASEPTFINEPQAIVGDEVVLVEEPQGVMPEAENTISADQQASIVEQPVMAFNESDIAISPSENSTVAPLPTTQEPETTPTPPSTDSPDVHYENLADPQTPALNGTIDHTALDLPTEQITDATIPAEEMGQTVDTAPSLASSLVEPLSAQAAAASTAITIPETPAVLQKEMPSTGEGQSSSPTAPYPLARLYEERDHEENGHETVATLRPIFPTDPAPPDPKPKRRGFFARLFLFWKK